MGGRRMGRAGVERFFREVATTWDFTRFEPRDFIAQGDVVVSLGGYAGSARATGRRFDCEFAHVFTIRNGLVANFREYTDTASLVAAAGAVTASR